MATSQDCPICCETYTKAKRGKIVCNYCNKDACRPCYTTFILSESQPNCMHCRAPWDRNFMIMNFTKTFCNGPLKKRREEVLLGTEEALLPGTQDYARLELERRELHQKLKEINQAQKDNHAKYCHIGKSNDSIKEQLLTATGDVKKILLEKMEKQRLENSSIFEEYKTLTVQKNLTRDRYNTVIWQLNNGIGSENDVSKEHRTFIKRCPGSDCNGFLSTRYNCGLCGIKVCSDCLEILPKEHKEHKNHKCNPDTVASVQMLKKDTCGCPKCGVQIHKIDGCDQMWCVKCHTAFSWRTGKIVNGVIHNPHWYEWQRKMNNGEVPIQQLEGHNLCDGNELRLPSISRIRVLCTGNKCNERILTIAQGISHTWHVDARNMPEEGIQEDINRDLRIKYLLKEIDRSTFMRLLQSREKKRSKDIELRQALEVCIRGSSDIINRYIDTPNMTSGIALTELNELRNYVNACLSDLCKRYDCSVRKYMNDKWKLQQVDTKVKPIKTTE